MPLTNPADRFYKINGLVNEFHGAQFLSAKTLQRFEIEMQLYFTKPLRSIWTPLDFHSIGPVNPVAALFPVYPTPTIAFFPGSVPSFFLERMSGIAELLDSFLEGRPITVLHFLRQFEALDHEKSGIGGDQTFTDNPYFRIDVRVPDWCFFVKGAIGLFTQGTGPGTFIHYYLDNGFTGLEFVPQPSIYK